MLSWLFGLNYWYDLLIVVVICATIVLCVKSEGFREILKLIGKYVGLPLGAILIVASAVYSCIHLNLYYTAQGGIYGQLSQIFGQNNQVNVEVDEKIFSFKDVILTQVDGDIYSAKMISEKVIKLKSDESYAIYVNNTPCTYSETSLDHFKALYTYNFYNKDDICEKTDTLELYFQLNNKGIEIEVQTQGGSSAVRYWNNYFNKNGFEVKVAKTEKQNDGNINIGEGDVSNYVIANFYNGEKVYLTQVYRVDSIIEFPRYDSELFYWTLDGETPVGDEYIIAEDTNFYIKILNSWTMTMSKEGQYTSSIDFIYEDNVLTESTPVYDVALRIVGSSYSFDVVDDLSCVSEEFVTQELINAFNDSLLYSVFNYYEWKNLDGIHGSMFCEFFLYLNRSTGEWKYFDLGNCIYTDSNSNEIKFHPLVQFKVR